MKEHRVELCKRITEYLANGGLFNPAHMEHDKVRALLIDCRDALVEIAGGPPIEQALELAVRYGGIDGAHHKAWVIDQMVRVLAGDGYEELVREAKSGDDGPETYDWNVGIAP